MSDFDIVRAWKDPKYRRSLTAEQQAQLPENPAGMVELSDQDLEVAAGAGKKPFPIVTTAITCTQFTFGAWPACGCVVVTTALTCTQKTFGGSKYCGCLRG